MKYLLKYKINIVPYGQETIYECELIDDEPKPERKIVEEHLEDVEGGKSGFDEVEVYKLDKVFVNSEL